MSTIWISLGIMKTEKITISRMSSNIQAFDNQIKIELICDSIIFPMPSKKTLIEVYVNPETFALALTGLSRMPCGVTIRGLPHKK